MSGPLDRFERIARAVRASRPTDPTGSSSAGGDVPERDEPHPFEARNIHPDLPKKVRTLFDDGHWEQSVFEAFKFIDNEVKRLSGVKGTGYKVMMAAFNEDKALIKLNALVTESEIDEQKGFKFIFAGAATGIRNPRGHEVDIGDTPDEALDYLALASLLLRRLDAAGLR